LKLLKQKKLFFNEGKSDKVYEVDLCESSVELFIVNFRYGRRNAKLREGTKTVFPVSYEEAVRIYEKLVLEKEKKGYKNSEDVGKSIISNSLNESHVNIAREETILRYLKEISLGTYTRNWKISRIILRVIDLNIKEAVPYMKTFFSSEDLFEQYNAILALAHFNDVSSMKEIIKIFEKHKFQSIIGRIAASYVLKLGENLNKKTIIEQALFSLPKVLKEEIHKPNRFSEVLSMYFLKTSEIDAALLYYIYLCTHDNIKLREQLYKFIKQVPLKVNTFKSIRYIYRICEVVEDQHFLALISKKIAISKPGYTSNFIFSNGVWESTETEKKKTNPSIAFSGKTKKYFNKSIYQCVYNYSQQNTNAYVIFVAELLSSLDDKLDNQAEHTEYLYTYENDQYQTQKQYFPKYHEFLALMYILYGSSDRLIQTKTKWYYTEILKPDANREEAVSKVWDSKPKEVLYILANTKSRVAVDFALRIIKDNPHFLENIPLATLSKLVSHYDPRVLNLILDSIEQKFSDSKPEKTILLALLGSKNSRGVKISINWMKKYEEHYFSEENFIVNLLFTEENKVLNYLSELFKGKKLKYNIPIDIEKMNLFFEYAEGFEEDYLVRIADLIGRTNLGKLLNTVSEAKIKYLANSIIPSNKIFALNLSKHNTIPAYKLFKDSYNEYINSDKEIIRKAGIEILGYFPDNFLIEKHNTIADFCFSEHIEVRLAIKPSIERLIKLDNNFKQRLLMKLLQNISVDENHVGIHENSYELIRDCYGENLPSIEERDIFSLVLSKYEFAQKLGTPLFKKRINLKKHSLESITELANSDILEIREIVQVYYKNNSAQINYELETALHIFNSDWSDMIEWSCNYFENEIASKNWNVEMLLFVCDHTKTEVQAFGRKIITIHFSENKGLELLLKLQEHPTKEMQFFVTNYLNNYAKDKVAIILKLETFFRTCLFNINTNRATKTRIYAFLETEAIKSELVAIMAVRLITAVLGTKIICDNSHNIDVLLAISEAHENIEIPLMIKKI
jgi:predicted DNA-binding WGR domain protein